MRLADLLLLALSWWDWRANRRLNVFPVALGVLLVYHVGTLTLHRVPAWNAFGVWFLGLPLPERLLRRAAAAGRGVLACREIVDDREPRLVAARLRAARRRTCR